MTPEDNATSSLAMYTLSCPSASAREWSAFHKAAGKGWAKVQDPFVQSSLMVGEAAPAWRNRWGSEPRSSRPAGQQPRPGGDLSLEALDSGRLRTHRVVRHLLLPYQLPKQSTVTPASHSPPLKTKLRPGHWAGSPESGSPGVHMGIFGPTEVTSRLSHCSCVQPFTTP